MSFISSVSGAIATAGSPVAPGQGNIARAQESFKQVMAVTDEMDGVVQVARETDDVLLGEQAEDLTAEEAADPDEAETDEPEAGGAVMQTTPERRLQKLVSAGEARTVSDADINRNEAQIEKRPPMKSARSELPGPFGETRGDLRTNMSKTTPKPNALVADTVSTPTKERSVQAQISAKPEGTPRDSTSKRAKTPSTSKTELTVGARALGVLTPQAISPKLGTSVPRIDGSEDSPRVISKLSRRVTLNPPAPPLASPNTQDVNAQVEALGPVTPTGPKSLLSAETEIVFHGAAAESVPTMQFPEAPARTTATSHVAPQVLAHRAAQQMAVALSISEDGAADMTLNPEELGRVKLSLNGTDRSMSVTILVERPETADLLRRNLDSLAAEFKDLGYSDINFHFGEGSPEDDAPERHAPPPDQQEIAEPQAPKRHTSLILTTGLDLKL